MRKRTRVYSAVERRKTVDAGRDRVLAAARELLEANDAEAFSVDAVARRAGVSRMTVYNQFESKAGLLEALFDSLAARGAMTRMSAVFQQRDARAALDDFVALFGEFWTESRRAHARLRAAATADPELDRALTLRNERRRDGLSVLVRRLSNESKPIVPRDRLVTVLFVLLGFDTFDALAGDSGTPVDVVPVVRRLVRATLGLSASRTPMVRSERSRSSRRKRSKR
ncbi:MAG TPA: helix-turn-helix domain-containing protein [Gemmatimonadaceae bacterium]|nr:helix-turn-helix domain-containing protein [Gemmatimonadaceae bacterium]